METAPGQLATIVTGSTVYDTRTYDDGGRLISSSYNNGVSETRSYNDDNTLTSISFSGAPIGDLGYTWDANKNKTSESIGGVMSGYGFTAGYDAEDRFTSWERADSNLDQSWDLSPVGDWNSITENTSVQNRTHGPVHEILTAAGQAVQHDPKGNMTQIPPVLRPGSDPLKLTWDFDNKLRAADTDNDGIDNVFYRWDALGRRVGRDDGSTHVIYFQDGQQTLADYPAGAVASSPAYTYVYGSYIDEVVLRSGGSGIRYYHRNQQYSVIALTDATRSIVERYAYTAYGQVTFANASGTVQTTSVSHNRYTYTGREWDQGLSLYHYRARMYDPLAGRFLSRDPIGFAGGSRNIYAFTASRPTLLVDPSGLKWTLGRPGPPGMGSAPRPREPYCTKHEFMEWYTEELEKVDDLIRRLEPCPCNINCYQETIRYCNGQIVYYRNLKILCPNAPPGWSFNRWYYAAWGPLNYHPGAAYDLRHPSGSQCMYDRNGKLMTTIPAAGTADAAPIGQGHYEADMAPYMCAEYLDTVFRANEYVQLYYEVRPQSLPCKGGSKVLPPRVYMT